MAGNRTEIEELMQGLQSENLRLYQILQAMANDLQGLQDQINPIIVTVGVLNTPAAAPEPPGNFTVGPLVDVGVLRFRWLPTDELSRTYEIRKGTVWETASFVGRTSNLSFDVDPVPVGVHEYLIKSINADGIYSLTATAATVVIPPIGILVLTAQIIDNNVLLRWSSPLTTWAILHYEVYRDTLLIGIHPGNFVTIFEQISGTYTYKVRARDIAGSYSDYATVSVLVDQPPDFELFENLRWEFAMAPVVVNAVQVVRGTFLFDYGDGLGLQPYSYNHWLLPVNIAETWQSHFTSRGWNTPQDQINAGFPLYLEPTINGVGSIQFTWDIGAVINSIIVNLDFTQVIVVGNVTVATEISWSLDNISYSSPVSGPTAFAPTFRYIRVKITGTTVDTVSMVELGDITVRLDVKRENDGGVIAAVSTDATGTAVTFNKAFLDIDTITGTAIITEGVEVVIDFVDVPSPTGFKVYAFDYAGQRVSCPVRWAARGIV